jgi:hypothetical protein
MSMIQPAMANANTIPTTAIKEDDDDTSFQTEDHMNKKINKTSSICNLAQDTTTSDDDTGSTLTVDEEKDIVCMKVKPPESDPPPSPPPPCASPSPPLTPLVK